MIQAIIIDDEKNSREALHILLEENCPDVEVIAEADGYHSAVKLINEMQPDLIFLDIQMPDGNGFRVLEDTQHINKEVIFTTAYDNYAIKAFKYSALDYLLKPIDTIELQNAVEKVKNAQSSDVNSSIEFLLENLKKKEKPDKLVLSTAEGINVVSIQNIIHCQSDDYYTRFFFEDRKNLLVSKTLKEYEQILKEHNFIRPHKSHLINIRHIKRYIKSESYIVLTDGSQIPVSRRKRDMVLQVINDLQNKSLT
ncbi:MAG: LytTR family DNA-binding domain-containing protein [Bacteroidales bacterium]|nr:LytTR family DNA-binding domain-containing protein [Bacteroidales bacterium]MCF8327183.1 LytTR family DNA-binding domain-containing protein [Bacteroidales bacterium]